MKNAFTKFSPATEKQKGKDKDSKKRAQNSAFLF